MIFSNSSSSTKSRMAGKLHTPGHNPQNGNESIELMYMQSPSYLYDVRHGNIKSIAIS